MKAIIFNYLLLLLVSLGNINSQAAVYYTSTTGNDTWSGTFANPFKTIGKGMQVLMPGDTLYVRGGTYREGIEHTGNSGTSSSYLTVMAYGTEKPVIKGSLVVTDWVNHSGSIWRKTGWTINSQQVFVDFDAKPEKPLQQIGKLPSFYTSWEYPAPVGSGLADMTAGTFYYDAANTTLYVWLKDGSSPNNHVMEASTRERLLFMHKNYIHIKGLFFRHSNSSAATQQGGAVFMSTGSIIEQCDVQWTDFTGIKLPYLGSNGLVKNCNVSNNGNSGINSAASFNYRVTGNTMTNNNYRNFNALWHAGGFKSAANSYGTVDGNEVAYNNGSGIWFDYDDDGGLTVVKNNYIHNNGPKDAGIFFEGSKNTLIYNNIIVNNARRGIYISASDDARVFNNTIIGCKDRAAIEVAGMPRSGKTLKNNLVFNNIIYNGTTQYDLYILSNNGTDITGNTGDYNCFYRAGGSLQNSIGGTLYNSLASWRSASGWDVTSFYSDPIFLTESGDDYRLTPSSPLVNKGKALLEVTDDYKGISRPQGAGYEIGAYEHPLSTAIENEQSASLMELTVAINHSMLEIKFTSYDKTKIWILDGAGRLVKEIQHQTDQPGIYSLSYNVSSLANGMFYCILLSNEAVITRKFIIAE